jgi:hypothetical protein
MIFKPDQKVMRAFANLRSNENFKTIVQFLDDCLVQTDAENRKTHDVIKTRWLQGQAQELSEILAIIELSKRL